MTEYTIYVDQSEIGTYEDVVESHIKRIFTEENAKKYQELPDGTHPGWDVRKQQLEQLLLVLNEFEIVSRYINVVFQHFRAGRWNECSINMRKMIEWMVLNKIDAEGTLFEGEQLPSMVELIDKYFGGNMASHMRVFIEMAIKQHIRLLTMVML